MRTEDQTIEGVENRFNSTWTQIGFPGNLMPGMISTNGYTFDKTTGTIVDYNISFGSNPVIPSTIDGVTVRTIGYQAFRQKGLIGVTLPESLQIIGEAAFRDNRIASLVIPNSVTSIGSYAFAENQIIDLTLGRGLRSTGDSYAFYSNRIRSLTIPSEITTIGYGTFGSNPLEEINIGAGVTSIRAIAFAYNTSLKNITIPSQVNRIDNNAFQSNNQITSVTIEGVENRFNSTWTQIGFPGNLMPGVND